ncbi:MAG: glutathione binding-like protein, partial [Methylobacteriaceae bacterium]
LADAYSIADIAALTWAKFHGKQGIAIEDLPNVRRWLDALLARPAVQRGLTAI